MIFVLQQGDQARVHIDGAVRHSKGVWHGIAQDSKLPFDAARRRASRHHGKADARQVGADLVTVVNETFPLEFVDETALLEKVEIDLGK